MSDKNGDSPRYTVVVEGYNQDRGLGDVRETMVGLALQSVPHRSIEVILVGGPAQKREWEDLRAQFTQFYSIKMIIADDAHYYALKNKGMAAAHGQFVAHIDSDTVPVPQWLEAIGDALDNGAEVTIGPTRFRSSAKSPLPNWLLDLAASISWGFVAGWSNHGAIEVRGFLSHNLGLRSSVCHGISYDERYGRTCAGSMLFSRLKKQNGEFSFNPEQCVHHNFSFGWWIFGLHARFGYEVFQLRRLNSPVVSADAAKLGWLEPLATMIWHVLGDVPQWFRFSRVLGWKIPGAIAAIPALLVLSMCARSSEMIAMYRTMINPEKMREFALRL